MKTITKEEYDAADTRIGQIREIQHSQVDILVSEERSLSRELESLFQLRRLYKNQQTHSNGEILARLADERVFSIEIQDDKIDFVEMCDEAFCATLTKPELLQLISELQAIADKLP